MCWQSPEPELHGPESYRGISLNEMKTVSPKKVMNKTAREWIKLPGIKQSILVGVYNSKRAKEIL